MLNEIIIISGSPSENSGSEKILLYMGKLLEKEGFSVTHISVKDVSAEVLFRGKYESPEIQRITEIIETSQGVIVGSPVYKCSYSGVLKALLDCLPQDVLKNKPVLPVMTGGSQAHLLAVEYALKPVLASLKGLNLKGLYFLDKQIDKKSTYPIIDEDILLRTEKQLLYFTQLVKQTVITVPTMN